MTDPTRPDPVLIDLLIEREARLSAGTPATPEDLCRACPERAEELRQLVASLARLEPFLTVAGSAAAVAVPGFELLAEIGRGGMGVVYKARDLALDRVVAVKVPSRADALMPRVRFEREVRTLAKLRHPNIVPVHSAALTGDTPYLVMEFVPRGNLAELAKEVAGTPARAVELLARVARAVAHAHSAGIVHRDLKPSNILIDDRGQPLVTDFGVAALLAGEPVAGGLTGDETPDDRPHAHTRLTRSGGVVGTPAYAAPEVYDPARFGSVGPATDIWAMGVILYQLLTGRRPFPGREWDALREQVCSGTPAPAPGVGRRWRRVIDRCLAKEPARRFRSADELADALTARGVLRWWIAGVGVGVAVALAGGFALLPRPEPKPATESVSAAWPNLPAVRDAQDRLARGEAVDLIARDRRTQFDWATGPGSGREITRPAEGFRVVNQSPVGTLAELLPALPPGRYRIDAELLHETGNGMSWVGVYAAASHCEIPRGRQHFLLLARYSDRGYMAEERDENNTVEANRRTHLMAKYLGDSDTNSVAATHASAPHPKGQLVQAPPVGWRQVSLTVTPTAVAADQSGTPVGVMTFPAAAKVFADACREYPDLPTDGWAVQPFGGVGVYVIGGSVTVRSFRITPLPTGE